MPPGLLHALLHDWATRGACASNDGHECLAVYDPHTTRFERTSLPGDSRQIRSSTWAGPPEPSRQFEYHTSGAEAKTGVELIEGLETGHHPEHRSSLVD